MSIEQLTSSRRWRLGLAVIILFTVVAALWPVISPSAQPLEGSGAEVHGTVQADLGTGSGPALPDASVFLRNVTSGRELVRVSTNLGGFFMLPAQPAGSYELCVEAPGFITHCSAVEVGSELVAVNPLGIAPAGPVIAGTARLANGSPCAFDDPSFGLSFETTVHSAASSQVVRANLAGEFVLPASTGGSLEVISAQCQAAQASVAVAPAGPVTAAEIVFKNQPPEVGLVYASQGGIGARIAAPGSAVEVIVEAEDPDGQPLSYTWVVTGSAEGFTSKNAPIVPWTLPDGTGLHTAYVLVTDGHGGVTLGRTDVSTDDQGILFAGLVREAGNGEAIAGAAVSVNGASATTDADGGFYLLADPAERYVISLEQPGYQLRSEVVYGGVPDGVYELVRSRAIPFQAELGGLLIEPQGPWGPGAQVVLEPGSLVRPDGSPASGPATAFLATVDLRDPADRFPGEYAGSENGGTPAGLVSLGAVDVQLFSAEGERLNIAPGREATVRIAVDPIQLGLAGTPSAPPPVVPIWFYNPETGVWDRDGEGTLAGSFYETRVRHFSVINADITFTNPACLRVLTNFNFLRFPYQIRVSVPAVNPTRVITGTVDSFISVVTYLPPNTPIKVEALDSAGNPIQTSARTVTTGGPSTPMPGPWPYSCTSTVVMTLTVPPGNRFLEYYFNLNTAAEADAYYAAVDPVTVNGAGTIRTFFGNVILGTGTGFGIVQPGHLIRAGGQTRLVTNVLSATLLVTESPFSPPLPPGTPWQRVGAKPNLAAWKTANGFGADENSAVYFNAGDLGFGRKMHMRRNGANVAYYVSNYPTANQAAIAKLFNIPANLIATVAMEYSPDPAGGAPYTKFYVFDNQGNRFNKADLDQAGAKYVPNLCVICHGQSPYPGSPANGLNARFIPFDLDSFQYPTFPPILFSRALQEGQFKGLNNRILTNTNPTPAITELVQGWYGGAGLPNATENSAFVPPGWKDAAAGGTATANKSALYLNVVKPSCRSCHATRNGNTSWFRWDQAVPPGNGFRTSGPTIRSFVCGPTRVMPNARLTYSNFWLSTAPHRPAALGAAGLNGWAAGASCPCGGAGEPPC